MELGTETKNMIKGWAWRNFKITLRTSKMTDEQIIDFVVKANRIREERNGC